MVLVHRSSAFDGMVAIGRRNQQKEVVYVIYVLSSLFGRKDEGSVSETATRAKKGELERTTTDHTYT